MCLFEIPKLEHRKSLVSDCKRESPTYYSLTPANVHLVTEVAKMNAGPILQAENENTSCDILVGQSAPMLLVFDFIRIAALSRCPVLILGETGTGKELVARAIHALSPCSGRPFVPVDCPSLPPTLIESELFGHVRGAFTGATMNKIGLFRSAEEGTVFLDEIGELSTQLQATLLRATDRRETRAIGSTSMVRFSARLMAATNRNLRLAVREGQFREDLYYRLNVLSIELPPLRDRRIDIPIIAKQILRNLYLHVGLRGGNGVPVLSQDALSLLVKHDWPGNVRELRNCLERAVVSGCAPVIRSEDIVLGAALAPRTNGSHSAAGITPLKEIERFAIMEALSAAGGDKLTAARLLGIGKTTLYRRLRDYSIK